MLLPLKSGRQSMFFKPSKVQVLVGVLALMSLPLIACNYQVDLFVGTILLLTCAISGVSLAIAWLARRPARHWLVLLIAGLFLCILLGQNTKRLASTEQTENF